MATRRYKCSSCSSPFVRKKTLENHIESVHEGNATVEVVARSANAAANAASCSSTQAAPQRRSQRLGNTAGSTSTQQQRGVLDDTDVSSSSCSASTPAPADASIADGSVLEGHAAALALMGNTSATATATAPQDVLAASVVAAVAAAMSAGATRGDVNTRISESAVVRGLRQKMAEEGITLAAVGSTLGKTGDYVDEVFKGQREATEEDVAGLTTFFKKSLKVLKYILTVATDTRARLQHVNRRPAPSATRS